MQAMFCDQFCSAMRSSEMHLQRGHSIVVDYVGVTAQLQQLTYHSRVTTFRRVHEGRKPQLVSFINSALRKAIGTPHAVDYDAHVTCEGSKVQVGVPDEINYPVAACRMPLLLGERGEGGGTWRNEKPAPTLPGGDERGTIMRQRKGF
jgi:hypothetical protein